MRYPNIKAECARNGLSADRLAQLLGITRKTLYNWEPKGNIPQHKVEEMASIFGVSCDYLLSHTVTANFSEKTKKTPNA